MTHTIATLATQLDATTSDVAAIAHQLADLDGWDAIYGTDTGAGTQVEVAGHLLSTGLELTESAVEQITEAFAAGQDLAEATNRDLAEQAIATDGVRQWFPITHEHLFGYDLDAGALLATWLGEHPDNWRLTTEGEIHLDADASRDLDRDVLAVIGSDLAATAEAQLDAVLTNAIDALAGEPINLHSADQIVETLRDLGFMADLYGQADAEFGIEVGKVPGSGHDRLVMSAWCWDPRQVPVDDVLSTGWVDVAAAVTAARLRTARRSLAEAERSFASSAAAAQAAGSLTWQAISGMLDMPSASRGAAQQWVTRKLSA
jgi:hypothetical protein